MQSQPICVVDLSISPQASAFRYLRGRKIPSSTLTVVYFKSSITMPHQHKSTIISFLQFTAYSNLDACIALTFIIIFTLSILELCLKLFVNLSQAIAGSPSVWFSLPFLYRWRMPILYKLIYLNQPHY
jgi:hypothetical protein